MAVATPKSSSKDVELDLTNSTLVIDGNKTEQKKISKDIDKKIQQLVQDQQERKTVYRVRNDFYIGNHAKYTNIVGLQQKEKKGHANATINYAGATAKKIIYALANNPPAVGFKVDNSYPVDDPDYDAEEIRTQATEDFTEMVFNTNFFWKRAYRRSVFNQVVVGDFAIKVYPCNEAAAGEPPDWKIKITAVKKMENLLVGWRGDDDREFDFVIYQDKRSIQSVKDEFGIVVPPDAIINTDNAAQLNQSSHYDNQEWGNKNVGLGGRAIAASGKNSIPSVIVSEYDDDNCYALKIAGQLVQYVIKDNKTYPKGKFWYLGENIPSPDSPWSLSDIDNLIDPNIELNEASNEERDYIRVGANTKYVAYNMNDFDPESVKTGSGGVIFVDNPNGDSKFEVLQTNVNAYPADSFMTRIIGHVHDMGIPAINFGILTRNSGRSLVVDFQSMVDLVNYKRSTWEIVIEQLVQRIQQLGYFLYKHDFFTDTKTDKPKVRNFDFNWDNIVPESGADKSVTVINKVQGLGLPIYIALQELGYKDPDSVIAMMKKEAADPVLMALKAKMFALTPGIQQATPPPPTKEEGPKVSVSIKANAQTPEGQALLAEEGLGSQAQEQEPEDEGEDQMGIQPNYPVTPGQPLHPGIPSTMGAPEANMPSPTLSPSMNSGSAKPMAVRGGTVGSYSSLAGSIAQQTQNQRAKGR